MGRQHYPAATRQTAVEAWILVGKPKLEELAPAVTKFREMIPAERRPHNPSEFVHDWVKAWKERYSVRSASPEPRRPSIDDDVARACVKQLKAGYVAEGWQKWYRSLKHAAAKNAYIKEVVASHLGPNGKPVTLCTLWRRMKAVEPTLTRRTLRYTYKLTDTHKRERLAYCTRLLSLPPADRRKYLARVVCIDSKKLYVVPEARQVYADNTAQLLIQDRRVPASGSATRKILYYAAVNAAIGPVEFILATGTSRQKLPDGKMWRVNADKTYTVRARRAASIAYESVPARKVQLGFCRTCATSHCSRLPHCPSSA